VARFLIQAPHTPENCLEALDELLARGPHLLGSYDFGCAVGDHSNHMCCTLLEAHDEAAARSSLPGILGATAIVTEVGKFTPEQVRSFHHGL